VATISANTTQVTKLPPTNITIPLIILLMAVVATVLAVILLLLSRRRRPPRVVWYTVPRRPG
jgi:hypothetical protein